MKESELKKKITLKEVFEEIRYVGLEHYLDDLTARIIDGTTIHYHKMNHTSPKNRVIHSYLYGMEHGVSRRNHVVKADIISLDK